MPRNKYPEETRNKILDVSLELFLQKGYEQTTILDIVENLGGLTRGAFYHHFKNKEDVVEAIFDYNQGRKHPFEYAQDAQVANGLKRVQLAMKTALQSNFEADAVNPMVKLAFSLMNNPRFLSEVHKSNQESANILAPMIAEGIADGSINVKGGSPQLLAELTMLLINFWMMPDLFPSSGDLKELYVKAELIEQIFVSLGFHVLDEEMWVMYKRVAETVIHG